jgi:hypothetical protein
MLLTNAVGAACVVPPESATGKCVDVIAGLVVAP